MPEFVPQGGLGLYYRQPGFVLQTTWVCTTGGPAIN